jgi:dGTPase
MNWNNIVSTTRTGAKEKPTVIRTEYQKDFDKLIFSSGFRRLQNKTQVFPLPGSTFVHNRLTHSLEVASVGRSLGSMIGSKIAKMKEVDEHKKNFYNNELSAVIASACLAHDIGNPAFGHSGEKAIWNYFVENAEEVIEGVKLKEYFSHEEWTDLITFEGNANGIRVLTSKFNGKSEGGLMLTYTTIASMLKYPCESTAIDETGKLKHRSKYGFFQAEKETVMQICHELNMIKESEKPLIYKRHPFVFIVEAADDICNLIIDYEDAHRLGILSYEKVEKDFIGILKCNSDDKQIAKVEKRLTEIEDENEKLGYLRAKCINALTEQSGKAFMDNIPAILEGTFNKSLFGVVKENCSILKEIQKASTERIYNHRTVVEIEIAGYNVMSELLHLLIPATVKSKPSNKDEKALLLIPKQFKYGEKATTYQKVLSVLDFISGMTDPFATDLYRKISGIEIPKHK